MLDELLPYYERELASLQGLAGEFAERYPKVARRLQLGREHCEDPHVERLLEGFAFLAARIQRKLDDDYPEITEAFMQVLFPHFLRPVPATTLVQLLPDTRETGLSGRYLLPRHAPLHSAPVQGVACQFRTAWATELWPLRVERAGIELTAASEALLRLTSAAAVITLDLASPPGLPIAGLGLDRLRVFLDGAPAISHLLYELLLFRLQEVRLSAGDGPGPAVVLPAACVRPVGFGAEEGLYGNDPRTFPGHQLLTEYLAFPEKFHFFDVEGLDALRPAGERLRLQFMVSPFGAGERHLRLVQTLSAANFKLGCVPVVNLFRHPGAPVRVSHRQASYPVLADHRHPGAFEVHSIDAVTRTGGAEDLEVPPFYATRHGGDGGRTRFYWYATRERARGRHDRGTSVELALVDLQFRPVRPEAEVLTLQLTCSNRDLPELIPFGGEGARPDSLAIPGHPAVRSARLLRKPTPCLRPPAKRGLQWRLISQLALNHLSLAADGPGALQELLELCNFSDSPAVSRQIQGLVGLSAQPTTARLQGRTFAAFVRGLEVRARFDEACFVGGNLFLFASVLERFLGHACPPNAFVRFHMSTLQQEGEVARWPPRTGEKALI